MYDEIQNPKLQIVPLPGASAVTTALSASGLPADNFLFLGFLPHKKGRETLFNEIKESKRTVIFYESPHRILKTLKSLTIILPASPTSQGGQNSRIVVVGRELTKIHEEFISGTPKEVLEYFESNPDKVRGEFTVLVSGK